MNEEEFYSDYCDGRRDFRNVDLKGVDFFTPVLRQNYPEIFDRKLSNLVVEDHPLVYEALDGLELKSCDFTDASIMNGKLLRVGMIMSSLKRVDARFASLQGSFLNEVDFTGADLRFAIFVGVTIKSAKFYDAILDHATFDLSCIENTIFKGCTAFSAKIDRTNILNCDFRKLNFTDGNFNRSRMEGCILNDCKFVQSTLKNTTFNDCSFKRFNASNSFLFYSKFKRCSSDNSSYSLSRFVESKFSDCTFRHDSFSKCDISYSKIKKSKFIVNSFFGAFLRANVVDESIFINPTFGDTSFLDMDISFLISKSCQHNGTSSIDHKSITKTIMAARTDYCDIDPYPDLRKFLEKIGMAPIIALYLIDSVRALSTNQLREIMSSTFISYGAPDEDFARKLNSDLNKYEINTFFFPLDATFGEPLDSMMHRINDYDRTILICSERSLERPGLLYELQKTIAREARSGNKSHLIPVALDNYVFTKWKPKNEHLRTEILDRVVADFTDLENYDQQFQRLLQSLDKLKDKYS